MDYIFGYTNFIDGSARGLPAGGFFQMKSRDTFAPIGPYIVTADEIADPQKLQIRLWNNGTLMQNFNTDDMAHKIPRCIEWLTSIHTLEPGDILATGTNHRGLNPFMDGDKIELEIEGLGRLDLQHQGRAEAQMGARAPVCNATKRRRRRPPAPTPTTRRSLPANTPRRADALLDFIGYSPSHEGGYPRQPGIISAGTSRENLRIFPHPSALNRNGRPRALKGRTPSEP